MTIVHYILCVTTVNNKSKLWRYSVYGLLLSVYCLWTSCISLSGLQSARTTPKKQVATDFSGTMTIKEENYIPAVNFGLRYGLLKRLDIGLKMSNGISLSADVKWQFLGDQTSTWAAAIGLGSGLEIDHFNAQIPIYCAYRPLKRLEFYALPRFIFNGHEHFNWLGSSGGLLIYMNKNTRLLFDAAYFLNLEDTWENREKFTQVSIGIHLLFNKGIK